MMLFDRNSGKTLQIRKIENDNFNFTEKNNDVMSFDRKSGKTLKIREIENDNFYFTQKMLFYRLTENPEKL